MESKREPGVAEPGERPPPMLERPPSARYATPESGAGAGADPTDQSGPATGWRRLPPVVRAIAAAVVGAVVIAVLGGPLSVTAGLVVAAAVVGYAVAVMSWPDTAQPDGRPARRAVAAALAVGSVVLGLVGIWLFARSEGGALGLLDYLAEVEGIVAPASVVLAGTVAWVTAR